MLRRRTLPFLRTASPRARAFLRLQSIAWLVLAAGCASSSASDDTQTPDDSGTGVPSDAGGSSDARPSGDAGAPGDAAPSSDVTAPPGDDGGSQSDGPSTQDDSSSPSDSGGGGDAPPAPPGVTVDPTMPGRAIADTFIGFSAEWGTTVRTLIGNGTGKAQKPTVQLFKNFAAEGNHPVLRVGGNSADEAYYLPSGGTLPTGLTIPIKSTDIAGLTDLNAQTGASMIPDLNLIQGDATNSASMIQALQAAFPAGTIRAFEIGNEPDNWEAKMLRPAGYTFADWTAEYDKMTAAMNVILKTPPPYAGPGTFTPGPWFDDVDALYAHEKSQPVSGDAPPISVYKLRRRQHPADGDDARGPPREPGDDRFGEPLRRARRRGARRERRAPGGSSTRSPAPASPG